MFEDNRGASELARNPIWHRRTKHIDVDYHVVRQWVQDGEADRKSVV